MEKLHDLSEIDPNKDMYIDILQQIIVRLQALRMADAKLILAIEGFVQDRTIDVDDQYREYDVHLKY